jgi:hypothetical protein
MFQAATEKFFQDNVIHEQLSTRVREGLSVIRRRFDRVGAQARTEWQHLPGQIRGAVRSWFQQLRLQLDIPERRQVIDLTERMELLQRQLDSLESRLQSSMAKSNASHDPDAEHAAKAKRRSKRN